MGVVISRCFSCGAPITWAVTPKGKRMPVDAEPVDDGNLVLERQKDGTLLALPASKAPTLPGLTQPRYVSHFATCPQAKEHRHRRAKE